MHYIGGEQQAEWVGRVRGVDPERCLVVPVDVGKSSAMALVADRHGEMVIEPFSFELTQSGVRQFLGAVADAERVRDADVVRIGVESAGHYHRTLVARLRAEALDVVELNPGAVKQARSQQLRGRLKTDERDLAAIAELLARGVGRTGRAPEEALVTQAAWAAHRRRKIRAHSALANQVLSQLDLVFPGLQGCFTDLLGAKSGRVIVRDIAQPRRICRLGVEGLRRYVAHRGVRLSRPKAAQVLAAAQEALRLPEAELAALGAVLAADVVLFDRLEDEIAKAEDRLGEVLPATPAGVLLSLPGVGVVRASNYGAGIGDPWRFRNAASAYRYSGLVPASYESAGKARRGQHISREGCVELREAIVELGRGLGQHDADFIAYRRRLLANGKAKAAVAIALGHRGHRLAFAMLRTQERYDARRWEASVAMGRSAMAKTPKGAHQNDVTCPSPTATLVDGAPLHNQPALR